MQVTHATRPTPGRANEDYVTVGPTWAVVLDGATAPPGVDSGCAHDVAWLVRHLAAALAARLAPGEPTPLPDVLAAAIAETRAAHATTCDLTNPDSPSSTVTMLRWGGSEAEYLVLADSPLVLDVDGEVRSVIDDRAAHLPSHTVEGVRAARNRPGGFWVAGARPEAAYQAVTGSVPADRLRRAALLSDGAGRYVECFALGDWAGLLDLLEKHGPAELIHRVRAAERAEADAGRSGRRGKRHDDATAVLVQFASPHAAASDVHA